MGRTQAAPPEGERIPKGLEALAALRSAAALPQSAPSSVFVPPGKEGGVQRRIMRPHPEISEGHGLRADRCDVGTRRRTAAILVDCAGRVRESTWAVDTALLTAMAD